MRIRRRPTKSTACITNCTTTTAIPLRTWPSSSGNAPPRRVSNARRDGTQGQSDGRLGGSAAHERDPAVGGGRGGGNRGREGTGGGGGRGGEREEGRARK